MQCPCGTGKNFEACCGRFISGIESAKTPEELMRSRYSAYSLANIDYIIRTMKPPASNGYQPEEARAWAKQVKWMKLEVLSSHTKGRKGYVEFCAYFTEENQQQVIHELSEFHLIDGAWYYVHGIKPSKSRPTV